ncbi:ABC transporter ATP-binding protein [Limobrevibacterium gyesilva]|uniref:ABC transporter ATP-binding protein n=1 Tax=Limobrevibacterium gyesilva TaxID=2991712 RepID=A0AA41YIR6_9PROT|nr:ABC transporter ATP-binding protein [Limobrevibacterium gyesilva]MCW3473220.1 ABC transporter ATP-binding protein [Limobrevibacterium gyesilva]
MTKLALVDLGRSFGQTAAVQSVSLALAPGEFVSLLGPSGCGKTTTLRMIAGFIKPTAGRIEMNGALLSDPHRVVPPEKRGMSMIFQSYAIWPNMTVRENVAFGLKLRRMPGEDMQRRLNLILDVVRLGALADRYPAELSGGQQQRVALARAIVIEPEVLLLDEPLSNLDANLREEMRAEIRRLHDEFRITTVYVTHDQSEAMVTSDRIVVMSQGRIEQVDDPVSLYNRPRTRFVAGFIGRTNFLDGHIDGGMAVFPGIAAPAGMVPGLKLAPRPVSFSVRPNTVALHRTQPAADGIWCFPGRIVERAFLGEHWDYGVQPDGSDLRLRVATSPQDVHGLGDAVWIGIDPARIVEIPPAESA